MTYRPSTDGCSELTCIYHGEENQRKRAAWKEAQNPSANPIAAALPGIDSHMAERLQEDVDMEDAALAEQDHWEQDSQYWDAYNPVEQGMYDDDPNPYHGDYAENDGY